MDRQTSAREKSLFCVGNMMFRRVSILVCVLLLLVHPEKTAALNFEKITSSARKIVTNNSRKFATIATAVICICGSPDYSVAAESGSLETQLKQLQNIKATNQKRRIEAAELELQSKELLYPEGRLIGRGIVKLMPENGMTDFIIIWDLTRLMVTSVIFYRTIVKNSMLSILLADENKLFPYGLPDPVSFDSNFVDKRSTLIVLAVGR